MPIEPKPIRENQAGIDKVFAEVFGKPDAAPHANGNHPQSVTTPGVESDDELLDRARHAKNGEKLTLLLDRGWQAAGYASPSEADQALCNLLAFWTGRDPARIDAWFRRSALMRRKWEERADYRERTISRAIAGCAEIYTGRGSANGAATISTARIELDANAPFPVADELLRSHFELDGVRTLHHWQGGFWRWNADQGRFIQTDELPAAVGNYLHTEVLLTTPGKTGPRPVAPTSWHTRNVHDALIARAHLASITTPPAWLGKSRGGAHVVACGNGLLDLETRELYEPTPEFFNLASLAANYRPDAKCPNWKAFLSDLWRDDEQSVNCLQEVVGYLLEPANTFQKIFMLIGPLRSGKGTIRAAIELVLGVESVAKPALTDFTTHFGLECLIGKLVAIIPDARLDKDSNASLAVDRILSISGGDNPEIPRKYQSAYVGPISNCRIVILANELPGLMDSSGALAHRAIMLRTIRSFAGREDVSLFEKKIAPERDGIFAWAVAGWERLHERGHFLVPDSAQGLLENFAEQMDVLSNFMRDCVTLLDPAGELEKPEYLLEKDQVYEAYLSWANEHGIKKPLNRNWFFNKLGSRPGVDCAYRYNEETGQTRTPKGEKERRRVKGLRLR